MDEEELKALEAILAPKPKRTRKVRRAPPGAGLEVAVSGHEGTVTAEAEIQQEGGET